VPFNVEFTIHRFAEFMMLMVGETVIWGDIGRYREI